MIADCETCDRKEVPCKSCQESQRAICYVCQGDVADPYCELEDRNWLALRNELDRARAERDSWEAQFHSAAAAASEYSEFWEKHHGDFDQFGNYIPHSQIDGDLRAAKAEIDRLRAALRYIIDEGDHVSRWVLGDRARKALAFSQAERKVD